MFLQLTILWHLTVVRLWRACWRGQSGGWWLPSQPGRTKRGSETSRYLSARQGSFQPTCAACYQGIVWAEGSFPPQMLVHGALEPCCSCFSLLHQWWQVVVACWCWIAHFTLDGAQQCLGLLFSSRVKMLLEIRGWLCRKEVLFFCVWRGISVPSYGEWSGPHGSESTAAHSLPPKPVAHDLLGRSLVLHEVTFPTGCMETYYCMCGRGIQIPHSECCTVSGFSSETNRPFITLVLMRKLTLSYDIST